MQNERYDYVPIQDQPVYQWPGGARLAVWVIPNIEHFRFDDREFGGEGRGVIPDVPKYSERDYGNRVGVWRLMDVLDRHKLRATVALNSDVCLYEPQIIEAGNARGWEWMGHGQTNSSRLTGLDEAGERRVIDDVLDTIARVSGTRPTGWLGPGRQETVRTPDVLAECGLRYVVDWSADDVPVPLRVRRGQLLMLPYGSLSDKSSFAQAGWDADSFARLICDQFDALYAEAETRPRALSIALHPYLSGRPARARALDKALAYVTGHEGIWLTTGNEMTECFLAQAAQAAQAPSGA
jgi:allantoinase